MADDDNKTMIYATDDLVQRARVIVRVLGFHGAVGDRVLDVYNVLSTYEKLDKEAKTVRFKVNVNG